MDYRKLLIASALMAAAVPAAAAPVSATNDATGEAIILVPLTLTKIDELKPAELKTVVAATEAKAAKHTAAYPEIFVTSSREKRGLDPLKVNLLLLAEA